MMIANRGPMGALFYVLCGLTTTAPVTVVLAQETVIVPLDPQPEDFAAWVSVIQDNTTPLPTCEEVGVGEGLGCNALCQAIEAGNVDVDNTRNVNELFTCACENRVACSDAPTCEQLTLQPGRVMEGCSSICGDRFTAIEDEVQYAGAIDAGNKDFTHFVMQCRCDGVVQCDDFLLFSDLGFPETCDSLNITSSTTCDEYCDSEGGGLFDLGGNYTETSDGGQGTCDCMGNSSNALRDVDVAQACTDIPVAQGPQACTLANPCPPPTTQNSGSGAASWNAAGGWASQSFSLGAALAGMVLASVAI